LDTVVVNINIVCNKWRDRK